MTRTAVKPLMHSTRIDISKPHRERLIEILNESLAHLIDLKLQVKQAHWNVKGIHFIALHELFDELATEIEEHIDTTAERAATLGGVARGTLKTVHNTTTLPDYPLDAVTGLDHLHALIDSYAHVGKLIREKIDEADNLDDKDTADLFTGVSRNLDLRLWFLEAHIQDHH